MSRTILACVLSATTLLALAGCAADKPQVTTDLNTGLEIAAALESAYAARPSADPKVVAELARLMAASQAAVVSWETSISPADAAAASAAIAALVAYEASAQVASK